MSGNAPSKQVDVGPCPFCGVIICGLARAVGVTPEDRDASGDAVICHGCGCIAVCVPGDVKRLRRPTDQERAEIVQDPAVGIVIRSVWARNAEYEAERARRPTLN